jgi:hypothetical protein
VIVPFLAGKGTHHLAADRPARGVGFLWPGEIELPVALRPGGVGIIGANVGEATEGSARLGLAMALVADPTITPGSGQPQCVARSVVLPGRQMAQLAHHSMAVDVHPVPAPRLGSDVQRLEIAYPWTLMSVLALRVIARGKSARGAPAPAPIDAGKTQ